MHNVNSLIKSIYSSRSCALSAVLTLLLIIGVSHQAFAVAPLVVMHRAPDSANDKRQDYNIALIRLALGKTLEAGESLQLKAMLPMNSARARYALNTNLYPNLILELSYEDDMRELNNIDYAAFPIDLGALSYRVCFMSPQFYESGRIVSSLADLKALTFVAGVGWPDVVVLKDNSLRVSEINYYDNIFKMLSGNRFDLFCRGSSEILNEYKTFNPVFSLHLNKSFALHYPLPRFFFVSADNQTLKNRLEKGLKMAYEDGSLKSLWHDHFFESVVFSDVKNRKVFTLENKRIKHINKEYEKYLLPVSSY